MNVADVYGGSRDVRKANARLIAAAPELLQSANEMLACLSFIEPNAMRAQVMLRAQTAIAKAQGKV